MHLQHRRDARRVACHALSHGARRRRAGRQVGDRRLLPDVAEVELQTDEIRQRGAVDEDPRGPHPAAVFWCHLSQNRMSLPHQGPSSPS